MGVEMEYSSRVVYRKRFAQHGVRITVDHQLVKVRRSGNQLVATFRHELTGAEMELSAAQVVIEHGTIPIDELYHSLREASANAGVTDVAKLLAGRPQVAMPRRGGKFELHRIGDAVTSRNVHAAIYDALRLCMAL